MERKYYVTFQNIDSTVAKKWAKFVVTTGRDADENNIAVMYIGDEDCRYHAEIVDRMYISDNSVVGGAELRLSEGVLTITDYSSRYGGVSFDLVKQFVPKLVSKLEELVEIKEIDMEYLNEAKALSRCRSAFPELCPPRPSI